jgi:copper chaperone
MQRYSVPKMTCGHCAGTINQAVKALDPQAEVTIDLKAKQVAVRTAAAEAQIVEAIHSAGYEAARIAS